MNECNCPEGWPKRLEIVAVPAEVINTNYYVTRTGDGYIIRHTGECKVPVEFFTDSGEVYSEPELEPYSEFSNTPMARFFQAMYDNTRPSSQ